MSDWVEHRSIRYPLCVEVMMIHIRQERLGSWTCSGITDVRISYDISFRLLDNSKVLFRDFFSNVRRIHHMLPSLGPTFNLLQVKFYSLFDEDHYYIERDIHGN